MIVVVPYEDNPPPSGFGIEGLPEPVGNDVPVEDHHLARGIEHLDPDGVLHRAGATDPAAVLHAVGDPHTLDEDYLAQVGDALGPMDDGLLQFLRSDDPGVAPVHKHLTPPLLSPCGDDGHRVGDLPLYHLPVRPDGAQDGAEIPHPSCVGDQFGAGEDLDPLVANHPVHQVAQQPLGILPFGDVIDVTQVPTQFRLPLYKSHAISGVGDGEGCGHPGDPPTDHQRAAHRLHRQFVDRLRHPHAGHRHPHQFLRLPRGPLRIVHMAPGAVLADVDHLQEVRVQPCLPHHLLEQRLMGPMATRSNHHPVEPLFGDSLPDRCLPIFEAAVLHRLHVDHIRQGLGKTGHLIHVHRPIQRGRTPAEEHPHPGRLPGHIPFRREVIRLPEERILPTGGILTQVLPQQPHRVARRARRIQDRLGDLLRRLERATDVDAGPAGLQRGKFVRLTEPVGI